MNQSEQIIVCDNCGKSGAKIRHVSRSYGKGVALFVIENVPIVSCPHCGESYLTAETLHEIERGPATWQKTIDGMNWLVANNFSMAIAGRTCWNETDEAARAGYAQLIDVNSWTVDPDRKSVV